MLLFEIFTQNLSSVTFSGENGFANPDFDLFFASIIFCFLAYQSNHIKSNKMKIQRNFLRKSIKSSQLSINYHVGNCLNKLETDLHQLHHLLTQQNGIHHLSSTFHKSNN